MNKNGILTTSEEIQSAKGYLYKLPTEDISFKGRLDSRSWGKRNCLVCNFTSESGSKIKLLGYRHKGICGNIYGPRQEEEINWGDSVSEGQIFLCTVRMSKTGSGLSYWMSAELISEKIDIPLEINNSEIVDRYPERLPKGYICREDLFKSDIPSPDKTILLLYHQYGNLRDVRYRCSKSNQFILEILNKYGFDIDVIRKE